MTFYFHLLQFFQEENFVHRTLLYAYFSILKDTEFQQYYSAYPLQDIPPRKAYLNKLSLLKPTNPNCYFLTFLVRDITLNQVDITHYKNKFQFFLSYDIA
jgi:hypothetical protein